MRDRELDREIGRLAIPAFATLLSEPLYLLTDTAIVGHLGTRQLAGLAVATSILLTVHSLATFLAYGTTSSVARLLGAGHREEAAHQAVQGLWLALGLGMTAAVVGAIATRPLVGLFGAHGSVTDHAALYLRVSLLGLPALLITLAGTGYLRGRRDTRTPLAVAVGSATLNLVLELVLITGLGFGLGASAAATVVAQWAAALVLVRAVARDARPLGVGLAPHRGTQGQLARTGLDLVVRTSALRLTLLVATGIAARIGTDAVAAHQIAFEIWNFLAMALDALAIAAQALVGHAVGAGDASAARATTRRLLVLGAGGCVLTAGLVLALLPVLPHLFTPDPVVARTVRTLLVAVAVLQPLAAVAFVLDGVLIGAGDLRYLAVAGVIATATFALAAAPILPLGLGVTWVWVALGAWMAARVTTLALRARTDHWLAQAAPA